jgi:hypothetical protein
MRLLLKQLASVFPFLNYREALPVRVLPIQPKAISVTHDKLEIALFSHWCEQFNKN